MAYANKYYDPQKAHEYYEKNKKLKGRRRSTKGFSQSQREMYSYVKDDLKKRERAERTAASERSRKAKASITERSKSKREAISEAAKRKKAEISEKAKAERQAFTEECSAKVKALRELLKGMSKEEKLKMREKINAKMD